MRTESRGKQRSRDAITGEPRRVKRAAVEEGTEGSNLEVIAENVRPAAAGIAQPGWNIRGAGRDVIPDTDCLEGAWVDDGASCQGVHFTKYDD